MLHHQNKSVHIWVADKKLTTYHLFQIMKNNLTGTLTFQKEMTTLSKMTSHSLAAYKIETLSRAWGINSYLCWTAQPNSFRYPSVQCSVQSNC